MIQTFLRRLAPSGIHPLWLTSLTTLWLVTFSNIPLWLQLQQLPEVTGLRGLLFGAGMAAMIAGLTHALLSLLNARWLLKPALTIFLLSAASGAYFMMSYGIVIDPTMIQNVAQTDPKEAADLFNWRMLVVMGLLGLLPAWVIWQVPIKPLGLVKRLLSNTLSLLASIVIMVLSLLAIYQDFASVMRNHTQVRYLINPLNSFYAIGKVAAQPLQRDNKVVLPLGDDARLALTPDQAPATLVLVLGETARMGNFGINGYERNTTPRLSQESVISLRNVFSCGTSTAASVPCMFSHLGREGFDKRSANHESVLDVLHRAGLAVLWVDNQSGCKGVCDRVPHVNTSDLKISPHCDGGECHDEVMLHDLSQRVAALPAERRAKGTVIVMHQMGSHGPAYYKRVPPSFKKFQPECTSNALQKCSREQVVNAYDNTILYTDHFLTETIHWLQRQKGPSALMYVSDHGESLGENNLYLHGLPYSVAPDVQKRVAWINWFSPSFESQRQISSTCLQKKVQDPLSHDNYFHSVLGLAGVHTSVYQSQLDVFASCKPAP
jgi:lipid A ethanolaminephosphotransferase